MGIKVSRLRNKAVDPQWQHEVSRGEDLLDAGMRLPPQCWWSGRGSQLFGAEMFPVLSGCGSLCLSVWCGSSSQAFCLTASLKMQDFKPQRDKSYINTVGQKSNWLPPILQVVPLKEMTAVCLVYHRRTSTGGGTIEKNPQNHTVWCVKNLFV